jgi:hypothetical protein
VGAVVGVRVVGVHVFDGVEYADGVQGVVVLQKVFIKMSYGKDECAEFASKNSTLLLFQFNKMPLYKMIYDKPTENFFDPLWKILFEDFETSLEMSLRGLSREKKCQVMFWDCGDRISIVVNLVAILN